MRDKKRSDNNGVESRGSEEHEDSPPEKKRRYLVNNRDKARERFNASDQGTNFEGFAGGGRPASPEEERPGLDSRPRRNPGCKTSFCPQLSFRASNDVSRISLCPNIYDRY